MQARVQDSLMNKDLLSKMYKERGQEGDRANSNKISSTMIVAIMAKPQLIAIFNI